MIEQSRLKLENMFTGNLRPFLLLLVVNYLAIVQSRRVIRAASGEETTGSYIVVLTPDTNHTRFETIVDKVKNESVDHNITEKVEGPFAKIIAAKISEEAAHRLKHEEGVELIEEETYAYGTSGSKTPWHIDRIDQVCSTLNNSTFKPCECGRGVDVYVLDSGINYGHCEFDGRARYTGYDPVDNHDRTNRQGQDCHGHGTHVASLAVGKTYGVARCATVYSVRVLRCDNSAPWSVVIDGVNSAARNITDSGRPSVISMSLGGSFFRSLDSVITNVVNKGIPVVVAAGNNRGDACHRSPASNHGAITVGGTARYDDVYYYTNGGSCVDILAPGSSITGADHRCTSCTCTKGISGTSQATPLVAGAVALLLEKEPSLSPSNITRKLTNNCIKNAINYYYLPSSYRTTTPNCLLHVKPCPSSCNSTGTVTRVVTRTLTMTAVISPSPVPNNNDSFCCTILQSFQNIQRNVIANVSSIVSDGVTSVDQLVTSRRCLNPTVSPLETP